MTPGAHDPYPHSLFLPDRAMGTVTVRTLRSSEKSEPVWPVIYKDPGVDRFTLLPTVPIPLRDLSPLAQENVMRFVARYRREHRL